MYCWCFRRKVEKDEKSKMEHQSESEYFEVIDFAKIRKNNMQRDEHIRNLKPSSETQIPTSKDQTTSHVEYYNILQGNTNSSATAGNTKTNISMNVEEKCFQYQSNRGHVNNPHVSDTEDINIDTYSKRTAEIPETSGRVDLCEHVTDSGTERGNQEQYYTNSPETDTYFILENTTSASGIKDKDISQKDTGENGVGIVQTHRGDGKVPMSDNVENLYLNQSKTTFDDGGSEEKGIDDMYFVLEKS